MHLTQCFCPQKFQVVNGNPSLAPQFPVGFCVLEKHSFYLSDKRIFCEILLEHSSSFLVGGEKTVCFSQEDQYTVIFSFAFLHGLISSTQQKYFRFRIGTQCSFFLVTNPCYIIYIQYYLLCIYLFIRFPGGSEGKESACNAGDLVSIPGSGRSPGEGHDNPLQYSCLENPHGQRTLAIYSPWGCKELDMTEGLSLQLFINYFLFCSPFFVLTPPSRFKCFNLYSVKLQDFATAKRVSYIFGL